MLEKKEEWECAGMCRAVPARQPAARRGCGDSSAGHGGRGRLPAYLQADAAGVGGAAGRKHDLQGC